MQRRDGRLEAILEQERLTTKGSPRRLDYQPSAFGDYFSKLTSNQQRDSQRDRDEEHEREHERGRTNQRDREVQFARDVAMEMGYHNQVQQAEQRQFTRAMIEKLTNDANSIEPYDRKMSISHWLMRFKLATRAMTYEERIAKCITKLRARESEEVLSSVGIEHINDWNAFDAHLKAIFTEIAVIDYAERFRERRQREGETVEQFAEALKELKNESSRKGARITDYDLSKQMTKGVNHNSIRNALIPLENHQPAKPSSHFSGNQNGSIL